MNSLERYMLGTLTLFNLLKRNYWNIKHDDDINYRGKMGEFNDFYFDLVSDQIIWHKYFFERYPLICNKGNTFFKKLTK